MRSSVLLVGLFAASLVTALPKETRADTFIYEHAEPFARRHVYLGAEGVAAVVLGQTGPRDFISHGGGFNLFVGGRLHRHLAVELGWQPTFHSVDGTPFVGVEPNGLGLSALTFELKVLPIFIGRIQPFVVGGGGTYFLTNDRFASYAAGLGYQVGGGVDFWLARHVSLGVKAQYRGVGLHNYDLRGNDSYLSLLTAAANLTVRF